MCCLSEKLKNLRKAKGILQKECSEATGISIRTLSRYENGYSIGDPHNLKVLAEYYEVPIDFLYSEKNSSH